MSNETILKSVFCNYRGMVTVYDVSGQKVKELSGKLTYAKYKEIEKIYDPVITEFDGLENYRCIACELKKREFNALTTEMFNLTFKPLIDGLVLNIFGEKAPKSPAPSSTYGPGLNK